MTFAEFCRRHNIQIVSTRTQRNPHMGGDDAFTKGMTHWHALLTYPAPACDGFASLRSMKFHFSKGSGHNGAPPTAHEALASLASDAQPFGPDAMGVTFSEWCGDYGLSTDSLSALKTYQACQGIAKRLRETFGAELFAEMLAMEPE